MKRAATVRCLALLTACFALGQSPPNPPEFEVASIHMSVPDPDGRGCGPVSLVIDHSQLRIRCAPLGALLELAYGIPWRQVIVPIPKTPLLDISAKFPDDTSEDKLPQMMQVLLRDRLKLVAHRQTRLQSIDTIVVGRGRLKIREDSSEGQLGCIPAPSALYTMNGVLTHSAMIPNGSSIAFNSRIGTFEERSAPNLMLHWEFSNSTLQGVADIMADRLGLPVLDTTGLKGHYHVALDISMEGFRQLPEIRNNADLEKNLIWSSDVLRDRFDAALRKVGLKLVTKKEAVEFLIVDSVERVPLGN